MNVPAHIQAKRGHAVVHFGLAIIIAIPIIGTLLGLGVIATSCIGIFAKSSNRPRDFVFLLAYPIVFMCVFGTAAWIGEFFSSDTFKVMFFACAATVPVSFHFIHTITGRLGDY
jgi:hypothetical protein